MTTADDLLAGLDLPDLMDVPPDPSAGPCWVDLGPYLDGSHQPPVPEVGARRNDGKALLYPGKSHLLVAETGIGKSWFGCIHVAAELIAGSAVVYAHFEEPNPATTLSRLLRLGVPPEVIAAGLRWADVDRMASYADDLAALDIPPRLVLLDGVVAACGGRSLNDTETVNWFRGEFVNPATRLGAAVLALHHPVKDPGRRGERGGRGSGSWIDLVDGVHFQMLPGKVWISKGRKGTAEVYADKDREAGVIDGAPDGPFSGWRAVGTLEVEDVGDAVHAALLAPSGSTEEPTGGNREKARVEREEARLSKLVEDIVMVLSVAEGNRYDSQSTLGDMLRAQGVGFRKEDLGAALMRLENQGRLQRAEADGSKPRPGWLTEAGLSGSRDLPEPHPEKQEED